MTSTDSAVPHGVLIVSRSLPCHVSGGLEFHVVDQAVGLARAGIKVHLLSTPAPGGYRDELADQGVTLHEVAGAAPGRYSLDYLSRVVPTIGTLQKTHRFDIVHGHEFGLGNGFQLRRLAPAKIALTVHGTITTETPLHPDVFAQLSLTGRIRAVARFGRRWHYAPWWHRALDSAHVVLVDSEFTRRELGRIRPRVSDKVMLVPLGMEMARYPAMEHAQARRDLNWPDEGKSTVLLTVGRLEWQKGHELALRALAGLARLDWRYVIIGEGREAAALSHLAEKLGLAGRVEFMGRAADEVKARVLAGADLFIWPERTHPAFGLAGLESLVMGTPVAAARRGAIPEIINETNGVLFDANDPAALAGAIGGLIGNPARLTALRGGLRERTISRVDPARMVRETLAAYAAAMGRS